jgi:hypothetical protein
MNTDKDSKETPSPTTYLICLSVFICVHLWLIVFPIE